MLGGTVMKKSVAIAAFAALAIGAASAMNGAAGQDRPGQPTQAKVWIQNSGVAQAVPTTIEEVRTRTPLSVNVVALPPVTVAPASVVQTRMARQEWEYRSVTVVTGKDPVAMLADAGREGWEATGLQFPSQAGAVVVLKRPR
jgi:hypothetical protein